ncbi:hypothetical protein P9X10_01510 [Bacillus cereus]|nr:hypothetical protein [Bacillus cereus]
MNIASKGKRLNGLLNETMLFNQTEFEFKALAYKILSLQSYGLDMVHYKAVLKSLDKESNVGIYKQFVQELRVLDLEPIVHTGDTLDTMKYAYKSSFLLLKTELQSLRGVVNEVELHDIIVTLRDFMLVRFEMIWLNSLGEQDYNNKVQDILNGLQSRLEALLENNLVVMA